MWSRQALGVTEVSQLLEAVQCSGMLELAEEDTKVRWDIFRTFWGACFAEHCRPFHPSNLQVCFFWNSTFKFRVVQRLPGDLLPIRSAISFPKCTKKSRRDFQKHPMGSYDPVSRTLYVEGLPSWKSQRMFFFLFLSVFLSQQGCSSPNLPVFLIVVAEVFVSSIILSVNILASW